MFCCEVWESTAKQTRPCQPGTKQILQLENTYTKSSDTQVWGEEATFFLSADDQKWIKNPKPLCMWNLSEFNLLPPQGNPCWFVLKELFLHKARDCKTKELEVFKVLKIQAAENIQ